MAKSNKLDVQVECACARCSSCTQQYTNFSIEEWRKKNHPSLVCKSSEMCHRKIKFVCKGERRKKKNVRTRLKRNNVQNIRKRRNSWHISFSIHNKIYAQEKRQGEKKSAHERNEMKLSARKLSHGIRFRLVQAIPSQYTTRFVGFMLINVDT